MTIEETNALQSVADNAESDANPAQENAQEDQVSEQTEDQQQETKTEVIKVEEPVKQDPPKKSWERKRIDQLTWEKNEERRKREALEAQLNQKPLEGEDGKQLSQADVDRIAEQKAKQIAAQQSFNQKCNATAEAGKDKYNDFDDAIAILGQVGLSSPQFLDIATDLPNSHEILYHLGKNPDEAERLLNLTPTKQAMELARLEAKLSVAPVQKQISKVAAPIKPLGGNTAGTHIGDAIPDDDDEYSKWRAKQSWANGG